jgi:hypothetical protein
MRTLIAIPLAAIVLAGVFPPASARGAGASPPARGAAARAPLAPGERGVAIPLRPFILGLRVVDVVARGDTLPFLFDTGGGITLVTPEVARRLGLHPYGRLVGHRMNGEAIECAWVDGLEMSAAGWPLPKQPLAVFDLASVLPPGLPPVAGILSLSSFRGRALTLDWPGSRLAVQAADSADAAVAAHGVPLRFATGDAGATLCVFTPVAGRHGPLWFLIDSGDALGTLVGTHVVRDSLLEFGADSSVTVAVGRGESRRTASVRAPIHYDGVLGTEFLQRGPVTLDLRRAP